MEDGGKSLFGELHKIKAVQRSVNTTELSLKDGLDAMKKEMETFSEVKGKFGDLEEKSNEAIRRFEKRISGVAEECRKASEGSDFRTGERFRLLEERQSEASKEAYAFKTGLKRIEGSIEELEKKNIDAMRRLERRADRIGEYCKKVSDALEASVDERLRRAEEMQSEAMKKMQNLRADENELKKIAEKTDFIERRIDMEKNSMELKVRGVLEKKR